MSSVDTGFFEPKRTGRLLGNTFRAGSAGAGAAFITAFAMLLPTTALQLLGMYLLGKSGALEMLEMLQGRGGAIDPTKVDLPGMFGEFVRAGGLVALGAMVIAGVAWFVAAFAAAAAVARLLAERALGRPHGPAWAWDFVLGRLLRLTGGGLVQMIVLAMGYLVGAALVGILAAVIGMATGQIKAGQPPGAFLQVFQGLLILPIIAALGACLASMPAAVGVEDLGGIPAVFRSFRLVSGQFRRVFVTTLLGGLILLGPSIALGMVMQGSLMASLRQSMGEGMGVLVASAPGSVIGLVAWPFVFVLQALIYFDLRSRQTEDALTPYALALDVGGELPEGVEDPDFADTPSSPDASASPTNIP